MTSGSPHGGCPSLDPAAGRCVGKRVLLHHSRDHHLLPSRHPGSPGPQPGRRGALLRPLLQRRLLARHRPVAMGSASTRQEGQRSPAGCQPGGLGGGSRLRPLERAQAGCGPLHRLPLGCGVARCRKRGRSTAGAAAALGRVRPRASGPWGLWAPGLWARPELPPRSKRLSERLCTEELISALAGALAIGAGQGRADGEGGSQ